MKVLRKQDFVHTDYRERVRPQFFHRPEDIQKFRVQPQFAKSVKDIMDRFVLGVTDYNKFNGNADIPVDTSGIDNSVRDSLLDYPYDPMSANNIDIVDDAILRENAAEALASINRKNVKGSSKVSQLPTEVGLE